MRILNYYRIVKKELLNTTKKKKYLRNYSIIPKVKKQFNSKAKQYKSWGRKPLKKSLKNSKISEMPSMWLRKKSLKKFNISYNNLIDHTTQKWIRPFFIDNSLGKNKQLENAISPKIVNLVKQKLLYSSIIDSSRDCFKNLPKYGLFEDWRFKKNKIFDGNQQTLKVSDNVGYYKNWVIAQSILGNLKYFNFFDPIEKKKRIFWKLLSRSTTKKNVLYDLKKNNLKKKEEKLDNSINLIHAFENGIARKSHFTGKFKKKNKEKLRIRAIKEKIELEFDSANKKNKKSVKLLNKKFKKFKLFQLGLTN